MRLGVFTDYTYQRLDGTLFAERAFALFLASLASRVEQMTLIGRLRPGACEARYALPAAVRFVPLPYYPSLARVRDATRAFRGALAAFAPQLDELDCVLLLGPHAFAVPFALLALLRGKRVVLGVRQDMPAYVRNRHPGRPFLQVTALVLEGAWRALALFVPVVVVGPDLARRYRHARRLLELSVSLVDDHDIVPPEVALERAPGDAPRVLSVGRVEAEKNPLLLVDALAALREDGRDWHLDVCGEGPLAGELVARARDLGLADVTAVHGYVAFGERLFNFYRQSDVFLHVSLTEGLPQVLWEAFAAGTPVVATDVGGIRAAVGDAVVAVPPGDVAAAAAALRRVLDGSGLRERLVRNGHDLVRERTLSQETRRLARFLAA